MHRLTTGWPEKENDNNPPTLRPKAEVIAELWFQINEEYYRAEPPLAWTFARPSMPNKAPSTLEIEGMDALKKFNPRKFTLYDGKSDPRSHIIHVGRFKVSWPWRLAVGHHAPTIRISRVAGRDRVVSEHKVWHFRVKIPLSEPKFIQVMPSRRGRGRRGAAELEYRVDRVERILEGLVKVVHEVHNNNNHDDAPQQSAMPMPGARAMPLMTFPQKKNYYGILMRMHRFKVSWPWRLAVGHHVLTIRIGRVARRDMMALWNHLYEFLTTNIEVFACIPYEMPGIDPSFIKHKLNIIPEA
ncbi:hypothetical protein Acr_00g0017820 [Actinidia rufa]|uniref:Uncharacterized protein n=1 Tax=Actinidia rufa TaxID=165716 RepID=A0A7J0DCQ0_9ERIC|nr:hypothetical protein Acr_00g0017820 [Actinidia rufa]